MVYKKIVFMQGYIKRYNFIGHGQNELTHVFCQKFWLDRYDPLLKL